MFFTNKMVTILASDPKHLHLKLAHRKLDCCMLDIDDLSTATQINTDVVKHRAMTSATNVKAIGVLGLT